MFRFFFLPTSPWLLELFTIYRPKFFKKCSKPTSCFPVKKPHGVALPSKSWMSSAKQWSHPYMALMAFQDSLWNSSSHYLQPTWISHYFWNTPIFFCVYAFIHIIIFSPDGMPPCSSIFCRILLVL